jgi:hypothetical protein
VPTSLLYATASEPANGTGPDRLPDALDISTTRDKNGTSTIEITIKTADDGQQMPEIRFTHSMLLVSILVANGITPTAVGGKTITAASLPASGTSAQIADLLKRMNACFALPTARRVNSLIGTGANVIAPSASRFSRMTVLLTIFTSVQGWAPTARFPRFFLTAAQALVLAKSHLNTSKAMATSHSAWLPWTRTGCCATRSGLPPWTQMHGAGRLRERRAMSRCGPAHLGAARA